MTETEERLERVDCDPIQEVTCFSCSVPLPMPLLARIPSYLPPRSGDIVSIGVKGSAHVFPADTPPGLVQLPATITERQLFPDAETAEDHTE